ncbi:MAG: HEWD family protein [Halolamina sp.]
MTDVLRTPDCRICERCARVERYDEEAGVWRATEAGAVNCIHEWDIDGEFVPVADTAPTPATEES